MPNCKACGEWFVKTNPHKELCLKCERALSRLSNYALPVVRCKDCKHRVYIDMGEDIGEIGGCELFKCAMSNDEFCSYGERKEEGGNNATD